MEKRITDKPVDIHTYIDSFHHEDSGAIVSFIGDVRRLNNKKDVDHLFYEAFIPLAEDIIEKILSYAKRKWKLTNAMAIHRIGRLEIKECAVLVLTSSPHRDEAYEANKYIIDTLKHEAPIWKKEVYKDGTFEWGNNCNCGQKDHQHQLKRSTLF